MFKIKNNKLKEYLIIKANEVLNNNLENQASHKMI